MKKIKLNHGMEALVDDDLYDWLNQWKWYAKRNVTTGKWYAARTLNGTTRNQTLYLHAIICPPPPGYEVDHEDTNTLNDQRKNLRISTKAQNQWNRSIQKNNGSGYKGIYWHKRDQAYRVQLRTGGKKKYIGNYKTIEKAILARDEAIKKYHGEFGRPK